MNGLMELKKWFKGWSKEGLHREELKVISEKIEELIVNENKTSSVSPAPTSQECEICESKSKAANASLREQVNRLDEEKSMFELSVDKNLRIEPYNNKKNCCVEILSIDGDDVREIIRGKTFKEVEQKAVEFLRGLK